MNELVEEIKKLQKIRRLSDTQLGREIGFDPSLLSKIKNGHRLPSIKFLKALAGTYPEIRLAVYDYMSSGDN